MEHQMSVTCLVRFLNGTVHPTRHLSNISIYIIQIVDKALDYVNT